jgi:methylglutaconyl-CoA hydratase
VSEPVSPAVTYELVGPVATLTLNRPDQRNVLNAESLELLLDGLNRAAADDEIRVVVLTGTGSTFCAGADMSRAASAPSAFAAAGPRLLVEVLKTLLDYPKPTIARIQGHVFGGGNGLVGACDLAVAVESALFAFSEVRVGVAPAVVSVPCLRVMDPRSAAEFLLTGERFGAERARAAGLISASVESEALDATVAAWVGQLSLGGPQSQRATRQVLARVPGMPRDEAFAWAGDLSAGLFAGPEAVEGMDAFAERRPPAWVTPAT